MGVLSNLIAQKNDIDTQRKQAAIQGLQTALTNPNATPETREWAMESIAHLADEHFGQGGKGGGKGQGKGAGVGQLFKSILSGLVSPYTGSQGIKQGIQQIDKSRPGGPMLLTPQQQETSEYQKTLREEAIKEKIEAQRRKVAIANEQEDYQRIEKELEDGGMPKAEATRQAAFLVKNRTPPAERAPAGIGKPTKQFVTLPGEDTPRLAWITPGQKGGILVDTGEPLPEDFKVAAAPSGADARTTYAQLLRSLHDEHPDWTKEQLASAAGTEYQRKYGLEIGATEQRIAINEFLSGIGGGAYTAKPAASAEKPKLAPKAQAPGAPAPAPAATGTPAARPATPAATPAPAAAATSPQASINQSVYFADALGNAKATGPERVRAIKGREDFKKATGLNPVEFEALVASDRGTAKAIIDTVERQASVQRVNEVLNQFGDEAVKRAQEVAKSEPDSPILKKPIRELTAATVGNPALARFLLAYNGFQRQYSTLTAGAGGLSRAQLPVGIADKVDKVLDPNATLQTVIDSVDQVKIEGKRELEGFNTARGDMAKMIAFSMQKGGGQNNAQPAQPQTKADFDALPSGTIYIDPKDKKKYRKP